MKNNLSWKKPGKPQFMKIWGVSFLNGKLSGKVLASIKNNVYTPKNSHFFSDQLTSITIL